MLAETRQENKRAAIRVTLIGSVLDFALGVLKIAVGMVSGSFALVTDGVHSFSDLLTDVFVVLIARVSHDEPDAEHPYGHARFETIGTIIIGAALFIVAGVICYDSIDRLNTPGALQVPAWPALVAAALSIVGKEWIFRYTRKVAIEINSNMVLANAWHSRSDAYSSIAVLVGILGAQAGYLWADLVAAIIVGVMIGKIAWDLLHESLRELVDTALPKSEVKAIRQHILGMTGIRGVHELRSRQHAGQTLLDIHVEVDSKISVSEGHYLGDRIAMSLKQSFPNIADVTIHIDPEHDTDPQEGNLNLPLRNEIMEILVKAWQGLINADDIEKLNLHYLNEKVQVEVYLRNIKINNELNDKLKKVVKDFSWLESLRIYGTF